MQEKIEAQAWFWSKEWQEEERKVDEEIKNNNIITFKTMEEAIKWLTDKG